MNRRKKAHSQSPGLQHQWTWICRYKCQYLLNFDAVQMPFVNTKNNLKYALAI